MDSNRQGVNTAVWLDNTYAAFPDWVAVDFGATKTVGEIDVYTRQDDVNNLVEPTATQTFSLYGVTAYDVQYWNGSAWANVPGGSVTTNNLVWRKFSFTPVTTSKIRVVVNAGADNVYSRLVEVEAYGAEQQGGQGEVNWLVTDHLGTPRMVADLSGSLAGIKRHDYLPFGEELKAGTGGRTQQQGYSINDGVRQKFTNKERDIETGLDYFGARYHSAVLGRFTSTDPIMIDEKRITDPQYINAYVYARNNPLRYIDPDGADPTECKNTVVVFGGGHWLTQGVSSDSGTTSIFSRLGPGGSTEGLGESSLEEGDSLRIAQQIKNDLPNTDVIFAGPDAKGDVFKELSTNRPDQIVIYGYSRGGIMAIELANDLATNGQAVRQITTVDPLTKPNSEEYRTLSNTPLIRDAVNFTNTPHTNSVIGATNVHITNADRANSGTPVEHQNLDDITAPRAIRRIEGVVKECKQFIRLD